MDLALLVALGGAAAILLGLVCVAIGVTLATGRRTRRALDASRADVEALRARLDLMTRELEKARRAAEEPADYLITGVLPASSGHPGEDRAGGRELSEVSSRAVLSVTVGEPLVRLVAFGYGVRRALSAENRNRIAFEMRREVRRARKDRRRELKAARRSAQAARREALAEEEAA
jgi:hypothetical protein